MKKLFLFLPTFALILVAQLSESKEKPMTTITTKTQIATFAGGCFWCMQPPFDHLKGVVFTRVGYTGGYKKNPTYEEIGTGRTGHAEAIDIEFDSSIITYTELLDVFWRNIDPTAKDRQFADRGTQYRTAIFYHNDEQRKTAEKSKLKLERSGKFKKPIVTEVVMASTFYPAEKYHQKYYQKATLRYKLYKEGSGRGLFLREKWREEEK